MTTSPPTETRSIKLVPIWSDEEILRLALAAGFSTSQMTAMFRDVGPYEITEPRPAFRAFLDSLPPLKQSPEPRGDGWTHVDAALPPEGVDLLYQFNGKWWPGRYLGLNGGLPCFGGKHGFVSGDATHWLIPPPCAAPTKEEKHG
jgi:hypothetical protein